MSSADPLFPYASEEEPVPMSEADYLALEARSEVRHERVDGLVYSMAGGTRDHGSISANCVTALSNTLPDRCGVFDSNVRITLPNGNDFYPDASATCETPEPSEAAGREIWLSNPQIVFEVSSPSTAWKDRTKKMDRYWTIPALMYYVLVETIEVRVDVISRTDDGVLRLEPYTLEPYTDRSAIIHLPLLGIDLPVADLYRRVEFQELGGEDTLTSPPSL